MACICVTLRLISLTDNIIANKSKKLLFFCLFGSFLCPIGTAEDKNANGNSHEKRQPSLKVAIFASPSEKACANSLCRPHGKGNLLFIILIYSAKTDNQFSVASLFDKAFKALFELVRPLSCRINVGYANTLIRLG